MLREAIYRDITNTIDAHSRFEATDFKLNTKKGSNSTVVLTISYLVEPKYYITFTIPASTSVDDRDRNIGYVFSGTVCPGPLAFDESFRFIGRDGIFERISTWLGCIWEELSSNPFVKKIENQQSQIDDILKSFETLDESYFTVDEATDLKARLDKLENDFKAEIQKSTSEKKVQEAEITKLHNDIETLKDTIASLKKKGWVKSFASKVVKWTSKSENRKLLGDGYKVVREFLPEEVKSALPE